MGAADAAPQNPIRLERVQSGVSLCGRARGGARGPASGTRERELAEFLGAGHCVGVANGTDALELALRALEPAAGSVVVTAANAGMYATTAARRAGLGCATPTSTARR